MRGPFVNCMRELKETTLDIFDLLFHAVHDWPELGISIKKHQGF